MYDLGLLTKRPHPILSTAVRAGSRSPAGSCFRNLVAVPGAAFPKVDRYWGTSIQSAVETELVGIARGEAMLVAVAIDSEEGFCFWSSIARKQAAVVVKMCACKWDSSEGRHEEGDDGFCDTHSQRR